MQTHGLYITNNHLIPHREKNRSFVLEIVRNTQTYCKLPSFIFFWNLRTGGKYTLVATRP